MAEVKKENWFVRTWGKVAKYFRELKRADEGRLAYPPAGCQKHPGGCRLCCVHRRLHLAVRLRGRRRYHRSDQCR